MGIQPLFLSKKHLPKREIVTYNKEKQCDERVEEPKDKKAKKLRAKKEPKKKAEKNSDIQT